MAVGSNIFFSFGRPLYIDPDGDTDYLKALVRCRHSGNNEVEEIDQ